MCGQGPHAEIGDFIVRIRYKVVYNDKTQAPVVIEANFRSLWHYEQLIEANAKLDRQTVWLARLDEAGHDTA